jgi:surfactin synthase thioesterase subunit
MAQGFVSPWRIAYAKTSGTPKIGLFSFPYTGGGASPFLKWTAVCSIDSRIYLCPVESPGRHSRIKEGPRTDVPESTSSSATALLPRLYMTVAFFGDSLGAVVADEVTQHAPESCSKIAAALEPRPFV